MTSNVVTQLEQIDLFSALSSADLLALADLAQREYRPSGQVICRQGERGHRFYLVQAGQLRVLHVDPDGIEQEVGIFGPGDSFGQTSLLLGEPHDATVEVLQDAALLYIEKEDLDWLLEERPGMLGRLRIPREIERRRRAPRFEWQDPDETVVFVLRKHDLILAQGLVLPGFLLLLVFAAYFAIGSTSFVGLVAGGLLAAVPVLLALYRIVDHFNDNYVLTNKRVMHDEHVPLIHQCRVGAPLSRIQSIRVSQEGAAAQMFEFGDLYIETAGRAAGQVLFQQIPDPDRAQEMIFEERRRAQAQARAEERAAIQEALDRRFGQPPSDAEPLQMGEADDSCDAGSQVRWPTWLLAPLGVVRYFIPSFREEVGDTIIWRKHWVALLGPVTPPTALIVLLTGVVAWLLLQERGDRTTILVFYGVGLLFLVPWWLWVFEDWHNEMYQVTPSRIIDIEQLPLALREERREASLGMIQNVNLSVPGVLGRLLGYGSVKIETAGAGAFTFDYVKNPQAVQTEIFRRMAAFEDQQRQEEAQRRRDELLDWFAVYDQMRRSDAEPDTNPALPESSGHGEPSDGRGPNEGTSS